MAEFEREMIKERVKAGMKAAKHRGQQLGRPKACFDRDRARALAEAGLSIRAIAEQLEVGRGTVHRALKTASQKVCLIDARKCMQPRTRSKRFDASQKLNLL